MVSIIIPIRYRADLTKACIDSIISHTKDYELILVHEGIDDDISRLLATYEATVINHPVPRGYSGALNAGAKVAKGDYLCFMNNDVSVVPGWMDEMLAAFDDEEVGLVCPTFRGMNPRHDPDWVSQRRFDYFFDPLDVSGVCFLVPKEVMEAVGEWDESFFHGGEDIDLLIRIGKKYAMVVARKSFIYHYGGASSSVYFGNIGVAREAFLERIARIDKKHGLNLLDKYINK